MIIYRRDAHMRMIILSLAALLAAALLLCGCSQEGEQITSFSQLKKPGTIIAVSTNTPESALVTEDFPDAVIQSYTDMFPTYQDVAKGKITAAVYARRQMELAIENGVKGVCLLDENYTDNIIAVALSRKSKIPDIKGKINAFIQELKDDGTLDDMYRRWVIDKDETMPDIPEVKNPQITLTVATTGTVEPYSYYIGRNLAGYDIELAKRFAVWLGADLRFKIYDFGGVIAAAQAGDVDCIMSNLFYTPEHEESVDFSAPLFKVEVTAMVRDASADDDGSLWSTIKSSFERTFIRESRWKLFLSGILTTLILTVVSILAGTLLGFGVFMACRGGNRIANWITGLFVWLVQGMPVVVLLMILYYIIFGSLHISGTIVSIIGFTIIFGAWTFELVRSSTAAVDFGQTEAAYSLGYTDLQAFFKVVLPQALPLIMPAYKGNISALMKATSVVGYIAVQDLTKMADIVRSRTYDAFFPLIAVAVIYFILEALLTFIVNGIEPLFNPRLRRPEDVLKGVELKGDELKGVELKGTALKENTLENTMPKKNAPEDAASKKNASENASDENTSDENTSDKKASSEENASENNE